MNEQKILDVTSLNHYIKNKFEEDLALQRVYIKGEISNLNKHYTGHYYFSLKDENSKISCTMFSSYVSRLKHPINNGDEVLIFGKVSVYDKLGTYQIYCYNIEPYGLGQYLLKLEELKRKLQEEGLFDLPKKEIPLFPKKIGVITSKSGAAVQDIIHTIKLRWPCEIEVYPCLVQGEEAPKNMVRILKQADNSDCDTLILARGGGANEDLKAFNDEELVRTVASLKHPIITAIGHQIDTSLVDFVSDYRCITPTEAGEKATPNKQDILEYIEGYNYNNQMTMESKLHRLENQVLQLVQVLESYSPINKLQTLKENLKNIEEKSHISIKFKLSSLMKLVLNTEDKLRLLDPRLKLKDGKSILYQANQKISHIDDIKKNQELTIYLEGGKVLTKVEEIIKDGK